MSRPLRIEFPGAWYHVLNRGAGKQAIFATPAHHRLFLSLLEELGEIFAVETHAYCLMDNHYHLLLHTPRGNLGRAMRHLGGLFTQRSNRLSERDGPLFRGRYSAILVDADAYLAQLGRYIHCNPVAAGLCRDPADYPWSSHAAYVGRVPPPAWLNMAPTLALFGRTRRQQHYQDFVAEGVDAELEAFYDRSRRRPVLGDDAFRQSQLSQAAAAGPEVAARKQLVQPPSIERIIAVCAREFGCTADAVRAAERGRGPRNEAREVALMLCRRLGSHRLREIAAAFHLAHYASVSNAVRRFEVRAAAEPRLARRAERLARQLRTTENS